MGLNSLPETVIAKFHYTDPTRTRPDPHGPAQTFFAAKLRWVRAGRRQSPRGSGRVRVVEFSFYPTASPLRFEPGPFCA